MSPRPAYDTPRPHKHHLYPVQVRNSECPHNPKSTRKWWALALIAAAQFMVIMDTSIIGVALPQMQSDLGFSQEGLTWVFNAYVIAFGGLLLLGGRLSDLFGARRVFLRWLADPADRFPLSPVPPVTSPSNLRAVQSRAQAPHSSRRRRSPC